jgi:tetratricopeptide (TPR) repeat protein
VAFALWPTSFFVYAQLASQNTRILTPPKPTLVAVHLPDLSHLEIDVREQLESLEESLVAAVKDQSSNDTKLSEAYGGQGEVYHAYSLYGPARECYVNASRLAPKDFRWIYLLAKLDHLEGNVEEARRSYLLAAALRPDYVAVQVSLGNLYLELNDLQAAKASFTAALKIHEQSAAAYYGLGQVALSTRSYAEALDYFERALALAPEANRIHYSLAMAYRGLNDADKARIHLAQQGSVGVRAADPLVDGLQQLIRGERVYLIRGRLALEAKRYAEAADEFRKAIASKPDSVAAHINLGAALTQTGDLKGAAEEFEKTLRLDPNNTNAHYNLAILLANENKHEQAIVHLQAVSKTNPNDLGARTLLGDELTKTGRIDEALDEFTRIVQADLNNEEALIEQVKLLQAQGRHKEALDSLERGYARNPRHGRTAALLAQVLAASPQVELRNGDRALRLAQLAYEATGSVEHGAVVGMALAELGRCKEAAEWQRKIIAQAEPARKEVLLARLKADLQRYEQGPPCRPLGDNH